MTSHIETFLRSCAKVHDTGSAVPETSYYPALDVLLSAIGSELSPAVYSVTQVSGKGAPGSKNSGIPDLGLFSDSLATAALDRNLDRSERLPEHGVVEVKPPEAALDQIAKSGQVRKYLDRYGKVILTNLREWRLIVIGTDGKRIEKDRIVLAADADAFWNLARYPSSISQETSHEIAAFLHAALSGGGSVSRVDDVARLLGAQAKRALRRIEGAEVHSLAELRESLETGLGMQFEGEQGERFFKSTLVQSLFYGVFSAWVLFERQGNENDSFQWRSSHWHLHVPIVRALFEQIASPTNLKPLGLDIILDATQETLERVDLKRFFKEFDDGHAVQYFYEPFISYFDPELRSEYGVWYTPPEVVNYMVERVDEALRTQLGREKGLADESVWVLDPCVGTGSFLLAVAEKIRNSLEKDALASQDLKDAVLTRLIGFELLPAPFVVSHLQLGLLLASSGVPLGDDERAAVYLTNSLIGWESDHFDQLPLKEFEDEREAATEVKQRAPILVVLGNPPYNGYAGVTTEEESELIEPYREGIATKNSLHDLYVRFFRIAERQIAERSGEGLICYISNFSYLHEPGFASMRSHLRSNFDHIYIDNLNGDSRETGKRTPNGEPDPSVFSTKSNRAGIQTGTAIGTYVRRARPEHQECEPARVYSREFWGRDKRQSLVSATLGPSTFSGYEEINIREFGKGSFRPVAIAKDYEHWTSIKDLAHYVDLGLNENRGSALIAPSREELVSRMMDYFDPALSDKDLSSTRAGPLVHRFARFDPGRTRAAMLSDGFDSAKVRQIVTSPLDYQWAYIEPDHKLWNESRPELQKNLHGDVEMLLLRNRAPRAKDGVPVLPASAVGNQHALHKDAYHIPLQIRTEASEVGGLFAAETRPNLSTRAASYLKGVGLDPTQPDDARLLWLHCIAVTSSPAYEEENSGGISADWPRVPLPSQLDALMASAELGSVVWSLLDPLKDPEVPLPDLGAVATKRDGGSADWAAGDLEVRAQWSILQEGTKVMPSSGLVALRDASTAAERDFGDTEVLDIFLNDLTYWSGVPASVWDLKIGGYQVLKKWLAYREHGPDGPSPLLGRSLTIAEARCFTDLVRRLAGFVSIAGSLDDNYQFIRTGALG